MGTPHTRWREMHHSERDRTKDSKRFRAIAACKLPNDLEGKDLLTSRWKERDVFKCSQSMIFDDCQVSEPLRRCAKK